MWGARAAPDDAPPASAQPYGVDVYAPLVPQVLRMARADYLAWVNDVVIYDGRVRGMRDARIFEWGFMEAFTKTVWWVVPLVWLPVAAAVVVTYAVAAPGASLTTAVGLLALGVVVWTLAEYLVHRFMFHVDEGLPDWGPALALHFLLHGVHHKAPMDRYRLVLPPPMLAALFIPVAVIAWPVVRGALALSAWNYALVLAGIFLGYVGYDVTHYSFHHSTPARGTYTGYMKRYHMKHHFRGGHAFAFGITSPLWDWVFRTPLPAHLDVKQA